MSFISLMSSVERIALSSLVNAQTHSLSSKYGFTNIHFTIQGLKTMALASIQKKANEKQRIER